MNIPRLWRLRIDPPWRVVDADNGCPKGSKWSPGGSSELVVADSHHLVEEDDPDPNPNPHLSEKLDPDTYLSEKLVPVLH